VLERNLNAKRAHKLEKDRLQNKQSIICKAALRMSSTHPFSKIVLRSLTYLIIAFVLWSLIRVYLITRTERIRTHITMHFAKGEHDLIFAVPAGKYLIHFAADPEAATSGVFPPTNVLACHIITEIDRTAGEPTLRPTSAEYMSFSISEHDAFQPQKLSVAISDSSALEVYMDIRPTF
jgi:hypothetical protein